MEGDTERLSKPPKAKQQVEELGSAPCQADSRHHALNHHSLSSHMFNNINYVSACVCVCV